MSAAPDLLPGRVAADSAGRAGEEEFDSIEEVEAVARSIRRIAIEYSLVILAGLLAVPVLSLIAEWWYGRAVWGGLTLNFITVALLLHVTFLVIGILFNRVANRTEEEMLGRPGEGEWDDV